MQTVPVAGFKATLTSGRLHLSFPRLIWVLAALAVVAGLWSVDFWLALAGGLWAAGALAIRAAFPRLRCRLALGRARVFAGERLDLEAVLANPGWWPIPWVEIASRQPEGLAGGLRAATWLPGGAVRTLRWELLAQERGIYRLGGLRLFGGDWFGLQRAEREVAAALELVVYPRVLTMPREVRARLLPEGPRRDPSSPFADDLAVGIRPYRFGDSRRAIAWRATARLNTLCVRDLPPVREQATAICLDLCRQDWYAPTAGARLEEAISFAASLIADPVLAARPLGLCTWAGTAIRGAPAADGPARRLYVPPRAGPEARRHLLRLLAGVRPGPAPGFAEALGGVLPLLPWGTAAVWIVPRDAPGLRELAVVWQSRGHPVLLCCLERREGPAAARVAGRLLRVWEVGVGADLTCH